MSLILRKLNFAADWRAVGRRCVVDPECCSTFIDIRPCDTPGACTWTVPTVLYVTYTGWPIAPFPTTFLNKTFALQITPYNQFASPENQLGAYDLPPIWALREGTNLSGQTFNYQWGPPLPAFGPGPRRAVKISTETYTTFPNTFQVETWWSMYLHPLCLGGLCPNGGFCDDFSFAYYLDVYEITRNLTTGSVDRICGSQPGAIAPAVNCGPIGRTVPYGGECTDIQLPADLVFTSSSGTITISA